MSDRTTERLKQLLQGGGPVVPETGTLPELLRAIQEAGDLEIAGKRLARLTGERLKELLPGKELKESRIALIGSFSVTIIDHMLTTLLVKDAIVPRFFVGGYNQYQFDIVNEASALHEFSPQITVCLLDERILGESIDDIAQADEFRERAAGAVETLEQLIVKFAQHNQGVLVLNTIPPNVVWADTIIDYRNKAQHGRRWRKLNNGLLALADRFPQVVVLDSDPLLARMKGEYRDERMNDFAGISYSESLMAEYAKEIAKIARAVNGKTRKCLVLDLDNTLWGGIVGEDLVEGIRISQEGDGKPYHKFQKAIKSLTRQGVLLAINSKNDANLVDEVFQTRREMVLGKDGFIVLKANWQDKPSNLREIAGELNIGIDSLVFVDDQPFECESVKQRIPEVEVVAVGREASDHSKIVLEKGLFNVISLTDEDRQRVNKYQSEKKRSSFRVEAGDHHNYLRGLEIEADLVVPSAATLSRLEQLELRTNQFNMTTRRYSRSALEAYLLSDKHIFRAIEARDRFGRYGVVGSILIEKGTGQDQGIWVIKSFILSCTVLSRGIETSGLEYFLAHAKEQGAVEVWAEVIETKKNAPFVGFYANNKFELVARDGGESVFRHDLGDCARTADWVKLTVA